MVKPKSRSKPHGNVVQDYGMSNMPWRNKPEFSHKNVRDTLPVTKTVAESKIAIIGSLCF